MRWQKKRTGTGQGRGQLEQGEGQREGQCEGQKLWGGMLQEQR